MAHTPGPWKCDLSDDHGGVYSIAGPDDEYGAATLELSEENARLIAAAPDLLTALKALVLEVELKDNPSDEGASEHCEQMDAARSAIAKAEGRS